MDVSDGQLVLFDDAPPERERRSREEIVDDYEGFVAKFEPKLTTDDCYTPPAVYDAVADWAAAEYGLDRGRFVRPFWPGGDFEAFPYGADDVVVDNPPFSILARIVRWYLARGIPFFLFAPALTLLSLDVPACAVGAGCDIRYENGAVVKTSFLTSLDDARARSAPSLFEAVKTAQRTAKSPSHAKYVYPPNVLTSAQLFWMTKNGVDFRVPRDEAVHVRALDAQRAAGKGIFGAGLLISDRLAQEKAIASAGEDAIELTLSVRERRIVGGLGKGR